MAYELNELCDMYKIYGESRGNSRQAANIYAARFPNRRHPTDKLFTRLDARMYDTGSLVPKRTEVGGPNRYARTVEVEDAILDILDANPRVSTRQIARRTNVNHSTVRSVIKEENLIPFHFTKVQRLEPEDLPRRLEFCNWLLRQNEADDEFVKKILWTDESLFTREGVFNVHNSHFYDVENPYMMRERGFQHRWKLNVWAGVVNEQVLGPILLPDYLNGQAYRNLLEHTLPELLEDLPLQARAGMVYQQDGAPCHNARIATDYLNDQFGDRWMGTHGPIRWPPRSPDLTVCDFFLWAHVTELCYTPEPETQEEVVARLHAAVAMIDGAMLRRVNRSVIERAELCVEAGGRQFQSRL